MGRMEKFSKSIGSALHSLYGPKGYLWIWKVFPLIVPYLSSRRTSLRKGYPRFWVGDEAFQGKRKSSHFAFSAHPVLYRRVAFVGSTLQSTPPASHSPTTHSTFVA